MMADLRRWTTVANLFTPRNQVSARTIPTIVKNGRREMFWNRIFTNSLVFVVKDETFNFDWISLETSAILSQVIKLQIHAASPDFIRIF